MKLKQKINLLEKLKEQKPTNWIVMGGSDCEIVIVGLDFNH